MGVIFLNAKLVKNFILINIKTLLGVSVGAFLRNIKYREKYKYAS